MVEIASIDVGNITTEGVSESTSIVIESRLTKWNELIDLGERDVIEFESEKYVVGLGEFENNLVKHEKDNFLALVYYTLAKITDADKVNLVIGIPAGQYDDRKDELKEFIKENNYRKISVNGQVRQIYINNVLVVPESYGLKANGIMSQCEKGLGTLVIDIGGGTTDIAEFDESFNFTGGDSIKYGLIDLYRNTRKVLGNKPYNLKVSLEDAKKYFDGDLELLSKDVSYKKDLMLETIRKIVNELRGLYPNLSNTNIILTGGGAEKIYPTFKNLYPHAIPVTDIKANAKGFYKIGVKAWQEK